jgi:N-acetylglucosaminyl-diphospho-decaprenol L-rhamnosyltransferase
MPELAVIYVNWNARDLLQKSIAALPQAIASVSYDVWVVDNASSDGSPDRVQADFPHVNLVRNTANVGFARANNQAMQAASGEYFLLINTDAFAAPGSIDQMLALAQSQPQAGIVGARLVNPDGSFQASYVDFPGLAQEFMILSGLGRKIYGPWYPNHASQPADPARCVDYVQGACLLVRRQAYEAVGGMDEGYFMYAEEVDWCRSMRQAGWQVWYQPAASVMHVGGASSRTRAVQRETDLYISRVRYFRKHHNLLETRALEGMIVASAGLKYALHTLLNLLNRSRFTRKTVSPVSLIQRMKEIQL